MSRKANEKTPTNELDLENWMKNLPEESKKMHLNDLILPGTHDSGATKALLNKPPIWAKGLVKQAFELINKIPLVKDIIGFVISLWTVTQKDDIAGQLKNGIRLFDFRLAKDQNNALYLGHTFLGEKFEDAITQIQDFTKKHPNEIVVINLKPDSQYSNSLTQEDVQNAHDMIEKKLGSRILNNSISLSNTTIQDMTNAGKNIVLYSNNLAQYNIVNKIFRTGGSEEIWPNKDTPDKLAEELKKAIEGNQRSHEFVYASVNCTPSDPKVIIKDTLKGESLLKLGRRTQGLIPEILIAQGDAERINAAKQKPNHVAGFIMDNPSPEAVTRIVLANVTRPPKTYVERQEERQKKPRVHEK